jgi:peptidoglycan-associated lipoprotein
MKHTLIFGVAGCVAATLLACAKQKAPEPPQPSADSIAAVEKARAESAAAEAAAVTLKERQDSAAEAARVAEAERAAGQRSNDSAAALARVDSIRTLLVAPIKFEVAKSEITPDEAALLDQKAAVLMSHPNAKVRISGHTDERGSDKMNMALGKRRAQAAKEYLVSRGVDSTRIETVSYGKERPLETGHDEGAWAKNRRDEFEILIGESLNQR